MILGRGLLLAGACCLSLAGLPSVTGCRGEGEAPAETEQESGRMARRARPQDQLPPLDGEHQARLAVLRPTNPRLPVDLARALLFAPSCWAEEMVRRVYPGAELKEDNPRVNQLFEVSGGEAPVRQVDVRWRAARREVIGSLVLTYLPSVDKEALRQAIAEVAQPEEGAQHDWLTTEGTMRISYYPSGYEGETRVAFAPRQLDGSALSHEDDKMKEPAAWEVAEPRPLRASKVPPETTTLPATHEKEKEKVRVKRKLAH